MDELVAAAQKEGVIELLAPSSTGQAGVQALGNALNKVFRLLSEARLRDCTGRSILSLTTDESRPSLENFLQHYLYSSLMKPDFSSSATNELSMNCSGFAVLAAGLMANLSTVCMPAVET